MPLATDPCLRGRAFGGGRDHLGPSGGGGRAAGGSRCRERDGDRGLPPAAAARLAGIVDLVAGPDGTVFGALKGLGSAGYFGAVALGEAGIRDPRFGEGVFSAPVSLPWEGINLEAQAEAVAAGPGGTVTVAGYSREGIRRPTSFSAGDGDRLRPGQIDEQPEPEIRLQLPDFLARFECSLDGGSFAPCRANQEIIEPALGRVPFLRGTRRRAGRQREDRLTTMLVAAARLVTPVVSDAPRFAPRALEAIALATEPPVGGR